MVERVFVHIGLPKTATSYLQTTLWSHREVLRRQGVVLPGSERRDHLWSSRTVREDPHQEQAPEVQRSAWARIRGELAATGGTGLISHEFFAAAAADQAQRMVAELAPAEVHLIVTAREPLGLFTAGWQESLKNGSARPMARFGRSVSGSPAAIWNWRTLDLRLVLRRWRQAVPPERIHVLVLDPTKPRPDIWERFAAVLGVDPHSVDLGGSFPNASMGVAEAETLRRVNEQLEDFRSAFDKGVYLRTFLADERLVPRGGERFWPEPEQIEDCRDRGRRAVAFLGRHPFDVRGDLAHLLVPEELEPRRVPASVTDAEVAEVAVDLVATMLGDVRELRQARAEEEGGGRRLRRSRRTQD